MNFILHALPSLWEGLQVTAVVTIGASLLALMAAFAAGLARRSRHRSIRFIAFVYIEFFRGTSALVQLFWLFYALPLVGIVLPAYVVGIAGLGLCIGAYGAEIVRAAVGGIGRGQTDAARALGLHRFQEFRLIVLPQALRVIIPQFGNLAIELLKSTALVSLITLHDLTFEAQQIHFETLKTTDVFLTILVIYYALAQLLLIGQRRIEAHFNRSTVAR